MPIETWLTFVAAVLLLMSTPGPSQLLMLSNCMTNGFRRGLFTAARDLTENLFQMLAAGLGLAAVLAVSATALSAIKWAGVAYLIYLGLRMIWRARPSSGPAPARPASARALWTQGFFTSADNPKAVVFFAALFPQFIDPSLPFWPQLAILFATYLALDGMFLASYGAAADRFGTWLKGTARAWIDRLGGGFLIGAAVLLGLKTLRDGPG